MSRLTAGLLTICGCLTTYPLLAQTYAPNYDPKSGIALPSTAPNGEHIPGQVYQDMIVNPGDYILESGVPQCRDGRVSKAAEQASALSAALIAKTYPALAPVAQYGGAIVGQYVNAMQVEVAKGTAGSLASLFSQLGVSPRFAACGTAALVVPMGFHITGYRFLAQNIAEWQKGALLLDCNIEEPPYLKCPLPDGRFQNTRDGNVVISTFINWAREVRFVRVVVMFEPDAPPPPPRPY